jgi:hypothetical protein
MKSLRDMTEVELSEVMTRAARAVEGEMPPGLGRNGRSKFVLLVFDDPEVAQYIATCERADVITAMRECADRLESKQDVQRDE